MRFRFLATLFCVVSISASTPALAQEKPWVLFLDDESTSACDVVNADNAELVVLQGSGQLVIVSGTDVTLADAFVDAEGFVSFEGEPAGLIDFVLDGDGLRSLWWTSLVGTVAQVNGRTGAPTFTDNFPEDYNDVPCDACDFWDDQTVCPDPTPPIFSLCGSGATLFTSLMAVGLVGVKAGRRRIGT